MTSSHGQENLACKLGEPAADGKFQPMPCLGKALANNSADFKNQADGQVALLADPRDPNRLNGGRDGIVGEGNPAPYHRVPVPRF